MKTLTRANSQQLSSSFDPGFIDKWLIYSCCPFQVQRVLQLLQNPYSDDIDVELNQEAKKQAEPTETLEASCSATVDEYSGSYDSKPPGWAVDLRVT